MTGPDERERMVDEAVAEYLRACEEGREPAREAFLAAHEGVRAELASFLDDRAALARRADPDATLAPAPVPAALGVVKYVGDYELLEEIARGGMGVVYRARQVSLNREVALKMILAGAHAGAAEAARFRAEASAAADLDHPNVCPIYEVGEHDGHQYYSMKLVPGGSLAGRKTTARESAALLEKVARAVHHAHQRGVIHRDLKPANVLLDEDGTPYVTDFGLARRLGEESGVTQSGAIVGTPSYMAPEQARAEKALSVAVDVWALGAVLYERLTGRPPFAGSTPLDTVLQVIEREPEPPSRLAQGVPRDLEVVALKCLRKEPQARYASAADVADELGRYLRGEPILARPASRAERLWRWCRRDPVVASLSAAILLLLLSSSVGATLAALRLDRLARQETHARTEADGAKTQARWQLARQYVGRGRAEAEKGDVLSSLPWYVEALALEDDDPLRAEVHRLRLGELLRYCPRVKHAFVHDDALTQARLSPDGAHLVTVDGSSRGRVWDARSGLLLSDSPGWVTDGDAEFDPAGARLARAAGNAVEVRAVPSGKLLASAAVPRVAFAVQWHPSGKSLLVRYSTSAGHPREPSECQLAARLFDAETGKPLAPEIAANGGSVFWTRFAPDGKTLATIAQAHPGDYGYGGDRTLIEDQRTETKSKAHLRDAATGAALAELPGDDFFGFEFAPDGRSFVTAHADGKGRIWDAASRKVTTTFETGGPFPRLAWSADGRHLLATGDKLTQWLTPGIEDAAGIGPTPVRGVGPGRAVLVRGEDGVTLWHPLAGYRPFVQAPLSRIACLDAADFAQLSGDGRTLMTSRKSSRVVHLWDVGVRACDRRTLGRPTPVGFAVEAGAPGGPSFVALTDPRRDDEFVGEPLRFPGTGATGRLSPDGRSLLVLDQPEQGVWQMRGYDVPSLKERFAPVDLGRLQTTFPPQFAGRRLALAYLLPGEPARVEMSAFDDGKLLGKAAVGESWQARFSADGSTLAAVWSGGDLDPGWCRAWSLPGMRPLGEAFRLGGMVSHVGEIGPGGRLPVSYTARDPKGRGGDVIDLATGRPVGRLPGHVSPRELLSDGRLLSRWGTGGRLWDVGTGEALTLPMAHTELADAADSHALRGARFDPNLGFPGQPVAYDGETGEAITAPAAVGVTLRPSFPVERRSVERLRLLSRVLSGRRIDAVGAVVTLEPDEYAAAWRRLCDEVPEARALSADEEKDWRADEASVAESWRDWKGAAVHLRWLAERGDDEARRRLARALAEQGEWAAARREALAAARRPYDPFPARVDAAWMALAQGDEAAHRGDVEGLLRDFEATQSRRRAGELLAVAAMGDAGAAGRALATYRRQRSADPDREAWAALAEAKAGRAKQALESLPDREQLKGRSDSQRSAAAAALRLLGREAEAAALSAVPGEGGDWRDRLAARLLSEKARK